MESSKRTYKIPNNILSVFQKNLNNYKGDKKEKGFLIIKNALNRKTFSFQNLKKIKHIYNNGSDLTKQLLGGDVVMNFVNSKLNQERQRKKTHSANKERAGMDNPHRKAHHKNSSAKPSFLNNSFQIFVNENIIKEFKPTNQIGGGSEGEVYQVGQYVIKRYSDLNPVKKESLLKKIKIHLSIDSPHLVKILDVKVGDKHIDVKFEKLKPIKNVSVEIKMHHLWYDEYYKNGREWNYKNVKKRLETAKRPFSEEINDKIMNIIQTHDLINKEFKKNGIKLPVDTFFPATGDNVMQDSNGTWKIIDF